MHTAAKSSGPKGTTQCGIWGALGEERLRVRAAGLVASSDLGLGLPTSLRLAVLILEVSAVGSSRSTRAGQWAQLMAAVGLLGLKKVGMHFTTVTAYISSIPQCQNAEAAHSGVGFHPEGWPCRTNAAGSSVK